MNSTELDNGVATQICTSGHADNYCPQEKALVAVADSSPQVMPVGPGASLLDHIDEFSGNEDENYDSNGGA